MKSKAIKLAAAAAAFAILGIASAASSDALLESKVREWFVSSKPVSQVPWVTDAKGCLYGLSDGPNGPTVIPMLRQDKTPICKVK